MRSAVTQKVNAVVAPKVSVHAAWPADASGQLRFLGSELPAPHGPLFVWLESQLHEHGPQPWAALRSGGFGSTHEVHLLGSEAIEALAPN